jgi:hypothetical protein
MLEIFFRNIDLDVWINMSLFLLVLTF